MGELGPFLCRRPDGRPRLMGIINITPDSFHADSRASLDEAVSRAMQMWDSGADWVDIGGESTRPGAEPVNVEEEIRRVVPVIRKLREARTSGLISIDTRRPEVAKAALDAGANMINDVSGLRNPGMMDLVIEKKCPVCIMHMQGEPGNMQSSPSYSDVVEEVSQILLEKANELVARGHNQKLICLDPGIGFGKSLTHNLELLHRRNFEGFQVLWGVSRKSMSRDLLGKDGTEERLAGTLGVAAHAMLEGVDILRIHDVAEHFDLLTTMATLRPEASK
jgi:dihydropteroate synthase